MANAMEKIKREIAGSVGKNYDIVAKRGRKKVVLENCTLDSAYPSIFVVKHIDKRTKGVFNTSFSYTDVLTKNVRFYPAFSIKSELGA